VVDSTIRLCIILIMATSPYTKGNEMDIQQANEMSINKQVLAELKEMKNLGVYVKASVIKKAETADLNEYNNMTISEIADLLIMLG